MSSIIKCIVIFGATATYTSAASTHFMERRSNVPDGSYRQSCFDVNLSGSTLTARCWTDATDGYFRNGCRRRDQGSPSVAQCDSQSPTSSLDIAGCNSIDNNNGQLVCTNRDAINVDIPQGPFALPLPNRITGDVDRGCRQCDIDLNTNTLTCLCPRSNIYRRDSSNGRPEAHELNFCQRCIDRQGSIAGSRSCRIGGFVQASCIPALYRETQLTLSKCKQGSPVVNQDGYLTCSELDDTVQLVELYAPGNGIEGNMRTTVYPTDANSNLPAAFQGRVTNIRICNSRVYLYTEFYASQLVLENRHFLDNANVPYGCIEVTLTPEQTRNANAAIIIGRQ